MLLTSLLINRFSIKRDDTILKQRTIVSDCRHYRDVVQYLLTAN